MSDATPASAAVYERIETIATPSVEASVETSIRVRIPPPPAAYLTQRPGVSSAPPASRNTVGQIARAVLNTFIAVRIEPEDGPGVSIIFGGSDADAGSANPSWQPPIAATS